MTTFKPLSVCAPVIFAVAGSASAVAQEPNFPGVEEHQPGGRDLPSRRLALVLLWRYR